MTDTEAIEVATKAMEDAMKQGGGDDLKMTKALAKAMRDPRVAQAFATVGYLDVLAEQNTKH
ncbi:hypothetical protein EM868_09200 [Cupriavidus gilardii]|uniref:hypothetical protein n=1 Tax=Cupriavidus gilardii TaxID=82541 RepID=UPI001EE4ECD2|nr:hypothetical protein [Cupriavidus gilardii]MCG5259768.1 hypothetical protein [Cupriavidus gilardii]MDF9429973.1 hypothetical protein [Cupriavidus gilardii]